MGGIIWWKWLRNGNDDDDDDDDSIVGKINS
jgi:hypothetical protein